MCVLSLFLGLFLTSWRNWSHQITEVLVLIYLFYCHHPDKAVLSVAPVAPNFFSWVTRLENLSFFLEIIYKFEHTGFHRFRALCSLQYFLRAKPWFIKCKLQIVQSCKHFACLLDRNVFGVPLSVVLQRTGQPLPRSILFAINYLQRSGNVTCLSLVELIFLMIEKLPIKFLSGLTPFFSAVDAVGIFRKSGGKQRINHLKEMIEGDPGTSAADSF